MSISKTAQERLNQLEKLGRYPTTLDPDEHRLVGWLSNYRQALKRGDIDPQVKAELDRILPGWETPKKTRGRVSDWVDRARKIRAWKEKEGRWPRASGKNVSPEEQLVGSWLQHARHRRKQGAIDDTIAAQISEILPGWDAVTINTRINAMHYPNPRRNVSALAAKVSSLEAEVRELRKMVEELKEAMFTRK